MVVMTRQITREQYNEANTSKLELESLIITVAKEMKHEVAGYGCYKPHTYEYNGKYFVSWDRLESCD